MNAGHPFREGNGRTQRAFCDALAQQADYKLDWRKVITHEYIDASIAGFLNADYDPMELIFKNISGPLPHTKITDHNTLDKETFHLIQQHVKKQLELTENIKQKSQGVQESNVTPESISQRLITSNNEAKKIAKALVKQPLIKNMTVEMPSAFTQKQGGFIKINARLDMNPYTNEDISAILRYAKSILITTSPALNQKNGGSR